MPLFRKVSQQSDDGKESYLIYVLGVLFFPYVWICSPYNICYITIGPNVNISWLNGETCSDLNVWMAFKPITSGCCIYQKEVKQVSESLCGAHYESGSKNKPLPFEVWIPHNCVNMNHSLQLPHSLRQILHKCWTFICMIKFLCCYMCNSWSKVAIRQNVVFAARGPGCFLWAVSVLLADNVPWAPRVMDTCSELKILQCQTFISSCPPLSNQWRTNKLLLDTWSYMILPTFVTMTWTQQQTWRPISAVAYLRFLI